MASTLQTPVSAARPRSNGAAIAFWIVTGLLCLWMAFTAYAQLKVPAVAAAFKEIGFPSVAFRVELSWAKLLGIAALLFPVPARIREWAYAGFGIDFISAFIAHTAAGQGPAHWLWSVVALALLAVSYVLHARRQSTS
jgi:hypothetical protein